MTGFGFPAASGCWRRFTLVNGWQLLAVILSAAALHELGHLLVVRLLGARVRELRVSVFGAELMTSAARLSYPGRSRRVLAGPAVNLLCALVLGGAHAWVAAGAHLSLCLFNLLPVRPLDGGRALYLAAAWLAGPSAAERTACWRGHDGAGSGRPGTVADRGGPAGTCGCCRLHSGLLAAALRELHGRKAGFL